MNDGLKDVWMEAVVACFTVTIAPFGYHCIYCGENATTKNLVRLNESVDLF